MKETRNLVDISIYLGFALYIVCLPCPLPDYVDYYIFHSIEYSSLGSELKTSNVENHPALFS
jgi:hypothetical protein